MGFHEHGINITFSLEDPVLKKNKKTRCTNRKRPAVFRQRLLFIIMISIYEINYLFSTLTDSCRVSETIRKVKFEITLGVNK